MADAWRLAAGHMASCGGSLTTRRRAAGVGYGSGRSASALDEMGDTETKTSILLHRWQQGDRQALGQILGEHLGWIGGHVRGRMGPVVRQKAETGDLVQETIVEFLRYAPRFSISNGKMFRGLLARIADNVLHGNVRWWIARRRDLARERPLSPSTRVDLDPLPDRATSPSKALQRQEREATIRLGLEIIDPKDREIIVLRDYDRLSFPQIGTRIGTNENAARQRYLRALDHLTEAVVALRRRDLASILDDAEHQEGP